MKTRDYTDREPPKSLGKEEFGEDYEELISAHRTDGGLMSQDIIATLTEFTAVMVAESYHRYIRQRLDRDATAATAARDLFVSGGGAHNPALMRSLGDRLPGVDVATTAELGVDPDAKEAMCFALLAHQTLRGLPTNVPGVTGASRPAVLGKICPHTVHLNTHTSP
ncbi:Anhydro-N-acetylmuramic acid kinase [Geodia barretti]|uniref:Anhydro-N-acetylmuramic acid kinase n=1 Tax=Geodia barretti TaxID=519541 RepID=A0AA35R1J5_GEOBA|nr:Anhydro-N-acetylmuramic acid kinase [Geodia barretti]